MLPDKHHESIFFSGHVQGVGFRYNVLQIAKEFEVAGYVKNLADGRVQIEVEGSREEVVAFIALVQENLHGHIRAIERKASLHPPKLSGFTIR